MVKDVSIVMMVTILSVMTAPLLGLHVLEAIYFLRILVQASGLV